MPRSATSTNLNPSALPTNNPSHHGRPVGSDNWSLPGVSDNPEDGQERFDFSSLSPDQLDRAISNYRRLNKSRAISRQHFCEIVENTKQIEENGQSSQAEKAPSMDYRNFCREAKRILGIMEPELNGSSISNMSLLSKGATDLRSLAERGWREGLSANPHDDTTLYVKNFQNRANDLCMSLAEEDVAIWSNQDIIAIASARPKNPEE
ncbi:uncharacterized protein L203_106453 [Cryptococcus depauperatus CBS 7841]|uniref:Uncharacterized protein n=1 Tax=Cryptococcus depauperatus CBS 7841 TaxID=1295531 RepID=A0A1E3IIX7_9TREE|nr:hypothetical protein L203_02546 [Cryptococcus depauperatus CBS 7841]